MKNSFKRRLAVVAVALLAAIPVNVVVAATPALAATCSLSLDTPYRYSNRVQASAEVSSGCTGSWEVWLWRFRWNGPQVLDKTTLCPGCWGLVSWVCTGAGTYTYRASLYHNGDEALRADARLSC